MKPVIQQYGNQRTGKRGHSSWRDAVSWDKPGLSIESAGKKSMPSIAMESVHHFGCTLCGECCRGWRLPLSLAEAKDWTAAGLAVDVLCQATSWTAEPKVGDDVARYAWDRSFPARSGQMPVRINITLTASLDGACPHLRADMGCAIYTSRPLACRIYPAGLDPFAPWHPGEKRCPEDAWHPRHSPLFRDGVCVNDAYRQYRCDYHTAGRADVGRQSRLCAALGIRHAALAGEGCVIHRPCRQDLLAALDHAASALPAVDDWMIVSGNPATVDALLWLQARGRHAFEAERERGQEWEYLGFVQV